MATSLGLNGRINFESAIVLLIERSHHSANLLQQIFFGFGALDCLRATSSEEARKIVKRRPVDLIVVDPTIEGGYEFITWLRRSDLEPNRGAPVIAVSANGAKSGILKARNSGASFFITKPLTPATLLDRILWVVKDNRPFVVAQAYAGPDRRFNLNDPPPGIGARRSTDVDTQLEDAAEPNMSQAEIDSLLKPQKVSL